METLQTRLLKLRAVYGIPVLDAEWITGISHSSINAWERGTRIPSADGLCQIVSSYGVSSDWLFGFSDIAYTPDSINFAESVHNISAELIASILSDIFKFVVVPHNWRVGCREALLDYGAFPLQARADILVCCLFLQGYDHYFKAKSNLNPTLQQKDRKRFFMEGLIKVLLSKEPISNTQQQTYK